jgi:hypothetical protein
MAHPFQCNDIEPVNSVFVGGAEHGADRKAWVASRRPSMACRWSDRPTS